MSSTTSRGAGNTQVSRPELIAEMLIRNYTKVPAADAKLFTANLVLLLSAYRDIEWIPDPINGIPSRFPYCPTIADIKAELDAREDHLNRQDKYSNWGKHQELPAPEETPEQRAANIEKLQSLSELLKNSVDNSTKQRVPDKLELDYKRIADESRAKHPDFRWPNKDDLRPTPELMKVQEQKYSDHPELDPRNRTKQTTGETNADELEPTISPF